MFVDEVDIHVEAGHGGAGCLAFRREKFIPRGGPSGGDGGLGGSVFVVASPHTNTLINYRFHPLFSAERGIHGQGSNCTGRDGEDLELSVPIGTLVYEKTQDPEHPLTLIADLAAEGQRVLVAKGGRGGMGNARIAAPALATGSCGISCAPECSSISWTSRARPGETRSKILRRYAPNSRSSIRRSPRDRRSSPRIKSTRWTMSRAPGASRSARRN